jgi:hypothetical protein
VTKCFKGSSSFQTHPANLKKKTKKKHWIYFSGRRRRLVLTCGNPFFCFSSSQLELLEMHSTSLQQEQLMYYGGMQRGASGFWLEQLQRYYVTIQTFCFSTSVLLAFKEDVQ